MNYQIFKSSIFLRFEIEKIFLITLGAIPGALIRWQLHNHFFTNMIGCGIIGFLVGARFGLRAKLLVGVGFCGALTTFSSWMSDCLHFLIDGDFLNAISLIFTSLFFGLLAAFIGLWLGFKIPSVFLSFKSINRS